MKFNKWTTGLAAIGVVSLASAAQAQETTAMSQVQTALANTTLSGYVDTAATWRPGTDQRVSGGPNMPAYAFSKNDGFSLNAVDIRLDRPLDESQWAAGYRVEMMLGPDAAGLGGFAGAGTDTAIRNAYVALRTPVGNGIDWKVGVWDSILGYENTSSSLDPNYTRSYGYTILPRTFTGVLASYKLNDMLSVQAGIADSLSGTDPVSTGIESQKAYMGAVTFTAPDSAGWMQGATFTAGVIDSAGNSSATGTAIPGTGGTKVGSAGNGYTIFHADATIPTPATALKVGAAFDYDDLHNGAGTGSTNPSNDNTWVIGGYGSYQATDKLSLNLRGEYVSSDGSGLYDTAAHPGNAAEELTATAQYNLWANVISRLEFRWDHVEHGNAFGANSAGAAFRDNDFLLALNLIYQF
ncbi:MAG: outer membrane beta-barrel protein [Verrucomicrobiota bacterium]|nr:outer membrane beta-barrel protein [Verrucomicrobiota bacterium]